MAELDVRGLTFRYEDMLMGFDLSVDSGEFLAIIGPSGAGKSTLLALIGGFERALSGRIFANGRDVTNDPPSDRPVTTLFQDHNLFAHLTVEQNVGLGLHPGLKLAAEERKEVAEALNKVGLEGFEQRLPGQLSGGERQRVALARCLIRRKPMLLLDEPFAALGPALRHEMLDLVLALQQELRLTVLMVSHDPADALYAATRTAFLFDGRVILVDATRRVLESDLPEIRGYLGGRP